MFLSFCHAFVNTSNLETYQEQLFLARYNIMHNGWKGVIARISTMEETFQSHLIDATIFQTKSFDFLSEFALLVSITTCSAYSAALSSGSE